MPAKRWLSHYVKSNQRNFATRRLAAEMRFGLSVRRGFRTLENQWLSCLRARPARMLGMLHLVPKATGLEIEYGIDGTAVNAQAWDECQALSQAWRLARRLKCIPPVHASHPSPRRARPKSMAGRAADHMMDQPGGLRTGSPPSPPPRLIRPTVRLLPRSPRLSGPGPRQFIQPLSRFQSNEPPRCPETRPGTRDDAAIASGRRARWQAVCGRSPWQQSGANCRRRRFLRRT
jgi:hypothetical protein